ncbi:MAG: molecular chaperone DnaK [Acidobacteriota bacterium]|nr:MAG: molecular chaperone DnaK [Acidobacteriota bacterium]
MAKIIGIDLGTTNSCVAYLDGDRPRMIASKEGRRVMPSVVGITDKNERVIGTLAKRQMRLNVENTVFAVKRLMGRKFDDPEVQKVKPYLPYQIAAAQNGDIRVVLREERYSPPEISAMILSKLREYADDHLGEAVREAIVTVPAYFDDAQRQATKDASRIAGLEVKRLVNEPTAAALAYGVEMKEGRKIIVYDLGGGTFDVTVLHVGEGVFEVLSTSGDTFLGGYDFDQRIVEWMIEGFKSEHGVDLCEDPMALQRLTEEAEKAKCDLSSATEVDIQLPFLHTAADGNVLHFQKQLTRAQLEEMTKDLIERTETPCLDALKEAKLRPEEIDEVLLVGGQTRMPKIHEKVSNLFNRAPNASLSPDEVVAFGASLQAGILQGEVKDIILLDVTPLSLNIETQGGVCVPMIERNSTVPTKTSKIFTTVLDNQTSVEIHVLQGESKMASANRSLGKFDLRDIPPAPRGLPEIEVTFAIDSNGIVNVSAVDKATGKAQNILIQPSSGLSEGEIERILKRAEESREEEQKLLELVQVRGRLQSLYYQQKRSYEEFKDLLGSEQRGEMEELFKRADEAVRSGSANDCNALFDEIEEASRLISSATLMKG